MLTGGSYSLAGSLRPDAGVGGDQPAVPASAISPTALTQSGPGVVGGPSRITAATKNGSEPDRRAAS
jgi:hypothetical protein